MVKAAVCAADIYRALVFFMVVVGVGVQCTFCGKDVESEWHVLVYCPICDLVQSWYFELDFSESLPHLLPQSGSYKLVDYPLEVFHLFHGSFGL